MDKRTLLVMFIALLVLGVTTGTAFAQTQSDKQIAEIEEAIAIAEKVIASQQELISHLKSVLDDLKSEPQWGAYPASDRLQWAIAATASSQYGDPDWGATQVVGEPDTYPRYGDIKTAWAPSTPNGGQEWIEVTFAEAMYISQIDIYETCNPGAVVAIEAYSTLDGSKRLVWQGTTEPVSEARILQLNVALSFPSKQIRIVLDTARVSGWNEIDAVSVHGR